MNTYDTIIIGAGPAGLALAQCLSRIQKKILIIEKEAEIGGCHRVIRVPYNGENVFTEHSPRIYSNTYVNFNKLLTEMNTSFNELFTPYNFSMLEIGGETMFSVLSFRELLAFAGEFFILIFNKKHGLKTSLKEFMESKNFSEKSMDIVNRTALLTDGAGIEKYTLYEFLQLFNQQIMYKLYQPKFPNDQGLFKIWNDFLVQKGVTVMLNTSVESINSSYDSDMVSSVVVNNNGSISEIYGDKIILAVPPTSFIPILENSSSIIQNSFMDFNILKNYAKQTDYLTYISSTFHWDKKINLPKIYGFPRSEWGVAFIVLSNYMKFSELVSQTVISCTITIPNALSTNIGKTANQCTKDEILKETFFQLKKAYPDLEEPTLSLLSPEMSYEYGNWETRGKAFITSSNEGFLPFGGKIKNLYNLGTQNGKCKYAFTSMETAVTNAIYLSHILYPELKCKYKIKSFIDITDIIRFFLIILILIIIILLIK